MDNSTDLPSKLAAADALPEWETDNEPFPVPGTFIESHKLTLKTPLHTPYYDLNLDIPKGSYVAVVGPHGSGKTPLLVTLAGRMKFTSGTLRIGKYNLPKDRRRYENTAGMAIFSGLNDLEWNIKSGAILKSELELHKKPHRTQDAKNYLDKWKLGHIFNIKVSELTQLDYDMFGIALGMINDPDVLVVDDIEENLDWQEKQELARKLSFLAHRYGVTVFVATNEVEAAGSVDAVIQLERK